MWWKKKRKRIIAKEIEIKYNHSSILGPLTTEDIALICRYGEYGNPAEIEIGRGYYIKIWWG